jgi:hypothetical protein
MISAEDARFTYEYKDYYKILPSIHSWSEDPLRIGSGKLVSPSFSYTSDNNQFMSKDDFKKWVDINRLKIGNI